MDAIIADAGCWSDGGPSRRLPQRSIGAAVTAGPVIFGMVGDTTRREFTVIGAPVNLAAKLEKANKPIGSQAITTASAYSLAVAQGYSPRKPPGILIREVDGTPGLQELAILHA
ncbi:MAG: Adenylate cyclase [uncultured Microvirga sp.]|uniref:Adenylate cyclase n=1 Tax=uncultured Microvirga sp. TaxID=412392 RepID=A0A6J4M1U4_9HYPH|nr:MAG: Adenylate cyclase [uncultured Microvirga sp.]